MQSKTAQFGTVAEKLPPCSADSLKDAKRPVKPAVLVDSVLHTEDGYLINTMTFTTPLEHRGYPDEEQITVTVYAVLGKEKADGEAGKDAASHANKSIHLTTDKPVAAYLCGGPGSDNPPLACTTMTDFYLDKGFQLLYMDYRGTNNSHGLRADVLRSVFPEAKPESSSQTTSAPPRLAGMTPEEQAAYVSHFCTDNIVRDLEAVRRRLSIELGLGEQQPPVAGADQTLKLTLIGQSYGGWIAYSYLSLMPEALDMVLVTGGIPPVGQSAERVYEQTFRSTLAANDAFYEKYPAHVAIAKRVGSWIEANTTGGRIIAMPGGGRLSRARFLCLGRTLGTTGGDASVRASLDRCAADLDEYGTLSQETLKEMEGWIRFEQRPLYALLQETLYTEGSGGPAAQWAAQRVANTLPAYQWLTKGGTLPGEERITFSAEHVFPAHYDDFQALRPLKKAAAILADKTDWPLLFDADQLAANRVPIAALSYARDIFIDPALSERTVAGTANIVHEVDGELMHTAVKDQTEVVCPRLWGLLGEAVAQASGRAVTAEEGASAGTLLAILRKAVDKESDRETVDK